METNTLYGKNNRIVNIITNVRDMAVPTIVERWYKLSKSMQQVSSHSVVDMCTSYEIFC